MSKCLILLFLFVFTFAVEPPVKMNKYEARALLLDFQNRSSEEISKALDVLREVEQPQIKRYNINKKSGCAIYQTELFHGLNLEVKHSDVNGVTSVLPIETPEWIENTSEEVPFAADSLAPEVSWLAGNFYDTDFTALVRVKQGRIEDVLGRPTDEKRGYVHHVYEAEVLEQFRGEKRKSVVYYVMADAGMPLRLPAYPLIVSLCSSQKSRYNRYFTPDNGYTLPASRVLVDEVKKLQKGDDGRLAKACE